jgi:hypothetical protein
MSRRISQSSVGQTVMPDLFSSSVIPHNTFLNVASGFFGGGTGSGGGAAAPYLYGTSSMYNFEYNQAFSVALWVLAGQPSAAAAVTYAGKFDITPDSPHTRFRGWFFGTNGENSNGNDSSIFFNLSNTNTNRILVSSFPTNDIHLGQWNFVVVTYDGSGTAAGARVYVNTVLQAANQVVDTLGGATIQNTVPFAIGGLTEDSGAPGFGEGYQKLHGNLNQITLWNTALTGTQITALYNTGVPNNPRQFGPSANLIGHYPLVEGSDTTSVVHDIVGGNHLTNSGVTLSGIIIPNPTYQNATCGSFNGTTSYLDLGDNFGTSVTTTPVTYSLWLNMAAFPSSYAFLFGKQNIPSGGLGLACYSSNLAGTDKTAFMFQLNGASGHRIVVESPTGIFTLGNWVHLAISYDGSQSASGVKLYANGAALTPTVRNDSLTGSIDSTTSFLLGMRSDSSLFFNGLMDEFAIFNSALAPSTIVNTIYNSGKPPSLSAISGLIAWYRFENAGQYAGYAPDDASYISDRANFAPTGTNHNITFSTSVP